MASYILLLHQEGSSFAKMSPEDIQAMIQEYSAWSKSMRERGFMKRGIKLEDGSARVVRGSVVTDGPFTEAREVIGGLYELEAADYEAAAELAKTCPHAKYGTIEVRRVEIG